MSAQNTTLDSFDRSILRELIENGRATGKVVVTLTGPPEHP